MLTHERKFPCEFCGKPFPRAALSSFLGGLACESCRKTFKLTGKAHHVATITLAPKRRRPHAR